MNMDKREMNNIRKENLSKKRTILLFEIVSINGFLIVPRYHFYEKELSEFLDERYLFIKLFLYRYYHHMRGTSNNIKNISSTRL